MLNKLNIVSYNCLNFKANFTMIDHLIKSNSICFFIEHWLGSDESYYFNNLCKKHSIIFLPDFENDYKKRGRPHGGRCWVLDDSVTLIDHSEPSEAISKITIHTPSMGKISIFGIWQPFDDGSYGKLATLYNTLSILESEIDNAQHPIILLGDFNADFFNRDNRFDTIFLNFISKMNLSDAGKTFNKHNDKTYRKGFYSATLDHICISNDLKSRLNDFNVITSELNGSDHSPVFCQILPSSSNSLTNVDCDLENMAKFHKFPWKSEVFTSQYLRSLSPLMEHLKTECYSEPFCSNHNTLINHVHKSLPLIMLKAARSAEKSVGTCTSNGVQRGHFRRCRHSDEILKIATEIRSLYGSESVSDHTRVAQLKRRLRFLQRRSIFDDERDDAQGIDGLLYNDRSAFWRRIRSKRKLNSKRAKVMASKPTPKHFADFFSNLFSHNDRPSDHNHRQIEDDVHKYAESIKNLNTCNLFNEADILVAIENLKLGKSAGFDGICNEFFKFGLDNNLISILNILFNNMLLTGHLPNEFNLSILVPIPKKKEISKPSDYRPISISTVLSTILESLILKSLPWVDNLSHNQFGYKSKTSCKSAFFVVNETAQYYCSGKSNVHVVSLDAAKAFDKMWRQGLFYKLINNLEPAIWRLLFNYYNSSYIIVRSEGKKSDKFKTSEGVKQGGILSPFLFNFFINDLIEDSLKLNVGAKVGPFNTSIIAYCDDILLTSMCESHMNRLLENCHNYATQWKMEFNAQKSISYSYKGPPVGDFKLGQVSIIRSEGFIYLGLPIGDEKFIERFVSDKFRNCEKSLYSLRVIGCKPNSLNPLAIAFIFKQFCQSIIKYSLDNLYLSNKFLNLLNVRQNILIKNILGIKYFARAQPLLNELKIEQVKQLYMKHKLFGVRQFFNNDLSREIFTFLNQQYKNVKITKQSFVSQLNDLNNYTGVDWEQNYNGCFKAIDAKFECNDLILISTIKCILLSYTTSNSFFCIFDLNNCLRVEFGVR